MLGASQRLAGSTSVWYQEVISVWNNASTHLIKLHCSRFGSSAAASAAGGMVSGRAARSLLDAARHGLSRTILAGGIATGLGVGWLFSSPDLGAQLTHARHVPIRLARDVVAAGSLIADYVISLRGLEGEELAQERRRCHERGAQRLLELCFANGGIYIKLGQHIGQLDHLLPEPYVRKMREHALDKCPVSSMDAVRQTFMDDLGVAPEQAFARFDPRPIASASLAQVHRAVAHDGRELAVKVQHPGLRESSAADISTVSILVNLIAAWFPAYNYRWLVDEIQENLPKELDFVQEADNAEACRANLASPRSRLGSQVVVPDVERELTSSRVLTMEFVSGVGVADVDGIAALGFRAAAVARLVARAFSEMIFTHGHVHCDPHEANMLVRRDPGSGALQLVLLDHGLYRQIDDNFRHAYARLWRSLVLADECGIREHSQSMNAGDMYPIFASMLTVRTWDSIIRCSSDHLLLSNSASDRKTIARYAKEYRREISELLLRMPRALLLLLKTNDCLRSVDRRLGQPVNTFVITARECTRALGRPTGTSFATKLSAQVVGVVERARIEWHLFLLHLLSVWSSASIRLQALLLGPAAFPVPGS